MVSWRGTSPGRSASRMTEPPERDTPGQVSIDVDPANVDWHSLHDLLTTAYRYMETRIDPPSSLLSMTADDLARKGTEERLITASVDDRLVGCAFCRPEGGWLYIGKMAVAVGAQRAGIGRLLIERGAPDRSTRRPRRLGARHAHRTDREPPDLPPTRLRHDRRAIPPRLHDRHEHPDALVVDVPTGARSHAVTPPWGHLRTRERGGRRGPRCRHRRVAWRLRHRRVRARRRSRTRPRPTMPRSARRVNARTCRRTRERSGSTATTSSRSNHSASAAASPRSSPDVRATATAWSVTSSTPSPRPRSMTPTSSPCAGRPASSVATPAFAVTAHHCGPVSPGSGSGQPSVTTRPNAAPSAPSVVSPRSAKAGQYEAPSAANPGSMSVTGERGSLGADRGPGGHRFIVRRRPGAVGRAPRCGHADRVVLDAELRMSTAGPRRDRATGEATRQQSAQPA